MSHAHRDYDTIALVAAGAFIALSVNFLTRNINRIVTLPIPRADGYWWTYRNVESELTAYESVDSLAVLI